MGLRFNVLDKRYELKRQRIITASESDLLELIILATIGARNAKRTICSKAELAIEDLSDLMGYKTKSKIWSLLKRLHQLKLIVREPTRFKGLEVIGLNPEVFGQILINTQHESETKRSLKCVVNNSARKLPKQALTANEGKGCNSSSERVEQTVRLENVFQSNEIIEEKPLLDSFRSNLDSFREKRQKQKESFTLYKTEESFDFKEPSEAELKKKADEKLAFLLATDPDFMKYADSPKYEYLRPLVRSFRLTS